MVISRYMNESEMGNRGSKSLLNTTHTHPSAPAERGARSAERGARSAERGAGAECRRGLYTRLKVKQKSNE